MEFTFEIRSLLGGNNGISRKNGFWQKMQSRRAEIRHQRFVYSKKHETRFVPGRAVCPPPHKIRSHHGGVSCTRRRMAKRERCTFLLHFFSNEAVNSFPSTRGTTLRPTSRWGGRQGHIIKRREKHQKCHVKRNLRKISQLIHNDSRCDYSTFLN